MALDIRECCNLQLAELEMIKSMFSNPGELVIVDDTAVHQLQAVIEGCFGETDSQLEFVVNLSFGSSLLEVSFRLPSDYPSCKPSVFTRSNQLDRDQSSSLNNQLEKYVHELDGGELCVVSIITWIQQNAEHYLNTTTSLDQLSEQLASARVVERHNNNSSSSSSSGMMRGWIHSHHIYSRTKRRNLLALAAELRLHGFCLPGKPGILCVEGAQQHVQQWWKQVKSWTWKRIVMRKEEYFSDEQQCRFDLFSELDCSGADRMSFLASFLQQHQCGDVFRQIIGLQTVHNN